MSLTVEQISSYRQSWVGKPEAQIAEEFASLSMETKRIPDSYPFTYNAFGKLISPETGRLIEDSIEKNSPLGKLEHEGFLLVERLGWEKKKGTILWFSPPHPERSNSTKIIVTNILNNPPGLFNRAFILDLNEKEAMDFANRLGWDYVYATASQLRKRPLYLSGEFNFSLLPDKRQVVIVNEGWDLKYKKEAVTVGRIVAKDLSQIEKIQQKTNIFGEHDSSCPPTAFEAFGQNSDEFGPLKFKCTEGHWNIRPRGKLITRCCIVGCKGSVGC